MNISSSTDSGSSEASEAPETPEPLNQATGFADPTIIDRALALARSWRRSADDRWLGGVCGGLANALSLPPLLVRVVVALLGLTGLGVPLYLLAWVLTPRSDGVRVLGTSSNRDVLGIGAIVLSGFLILVWGGQVNLFFTMWRLFPWIAICLGVALVLRRSDSTMPTAGPTGAVPPPPPSPSATYLSDPSHAGAPPVLNYRYVAPPQPIPVPLPPRAPRARPFLTPAAMAIALAAMLVLAALGFAGVSSLHAGVIGSIILLIFAAGLLVSSIRGRAHGLVLVAVPLAAALGLLSLAGVRTDARGGSLSREVANEVDLAGAYEVAAGTLDLDIARLDLSADRTVSIRMTAGDANIYLPLDVHTRVVGSFGIGSLRELRPSLSESQYDTEMFDRLQSRTNSPADGDRLEKSDVSRFGVNLPWSWGGNEGSDPIRSFDRTFGPASGPLLTLNVEMGAGQLNLFNPVWIGDLPVTSAPVQICTVGGGTRGVVKPCTDVPSALRVATCLDSDYYTGQVYDCREVAIDNGGEFGDGGGIGMSSPVLACRDMFAQYAPCDQTEAEIVVELPKGIPMSEDTVPTVER